MTLLEIVPYWSSVFSYNLPAVVIHILGMTNLRLYIFPAGGNEIALPWGCGPQRPSELGGSNLSLQFMGGTVTGL